MNLQISSKIGKLLRQQQQQTAMSNIGETDDTPQTISPRNTKLHGWKTTKATETVCVICLLQPHLTSRLPSPLV